MQYPVSGHVGLSCWVLHGLPSHLSSYNWMWGRLLYTKDFVST